MRGDSANIYWGCFDAIIETDVSLDLIQAYDADYLILFVSYLPFVPRTSSI